MSVSQPKEKDQDQESLKGMSQPIRFNEADPQDDQPKKKLNHLNMVQNQCLIDHTH